MGDDRGRFANGLESYVLSIGTCVKHFSLFREMRVVSIAVGIWWSVGQFCSINIFRLVVVHCLETVLIRQHLIYVQIQWLPGDCLVTVRRL